jgi:hypothetical protein
MAGCGGTNPMAQNNRSFLRRFFSKKRLLNLGLVEIHRELMTAAAR